MAEDDIVSREELEDAVISKFDSIYDGDMEYELYGGRDEFVDGLSHLSDDALAFMAEADRDSIEEYANYGFDEGQEDPPDWLEELGWYDDDGDWHNPFWYH